jgi:hypothetical protein
MGEMADPGGWTLHARAPIDARWRLRRDGELIAETTGPRLSAPADDAGVYRVEALRRARGRERTWIVSNPVYLK